MHHKTHKMRSGFTLVEIMIVVAIIALLAAIALPSFMRARKRSQATTILNDLRLLDAALDQYAADTAKPKGYTAQFGDVQNYLKTDTTLYNSGGVDLIGDTYGPFVVDSIPQVPDNTFNQYSDVADAGFWGQFYGAKPPLMDQFLSALGQLAAQVSSGVDVNSPQFVASFAAMAQEASQLGINSPADALQIIPQGQQEQAMMAFKTLSDAGAFPSGGSTTVTGTN